MKQLFIALLFIYNSLCAMSQNRNWQHKDPETDQIFGISTEKAYQELLMNKKKKPVIVAIIDSGTDTCHEALQSIIWTDKQTGDHGQNYIGSEEGAEDITYLALSKKEFYDSLSYTMVPEVYRSGYQAHRKIMEEYNDHVNGMRQAIAELTKSRAIIDGILNNIGKANPSLQDFKDYPAKDKEAEMLRKIINSFAVYPTFTDLRWNELEKPLLLAQDHLNKGLSLDSANSGISRVLADNKISPDAIGLVVHPNYTPYHGTHVAGIIGAKRTNSSKVIGIADSVYLMTLKVIGNIRELRDNNLAAAIRYAADHGAKVINLSFGKPYSLNKEAVDDAVKYAMKKDVLIVHAAGNAGMDLDHIPHFPNPEYDKGGQAQAWIEVGASGLKDDSTLAAEFSNYGHASVDVFAPGVQIYSCIPNKQYASFDGTSMAAPVVSGLAALLREYYPKLNAREVKDIIMKSVKKVDHSVWVKDNLGKAQKVPFSSICISGGIVNVYRALKLAEAYK